MFVVLLRFSSQRHQAPTHMAGHMKWLQQGFDGGVFALAGSIAPTAGGAVLVHGLTRAEVEARVALDPFVAEDVVSAEVIEITPSRTDPRLSFLS